LDIFIEYGNRSDIEMVASTLFFANCKYRPHDESSVHCKFICGIQTIEHVYTQFLQVPPSSKQQQNQELTNKPRFSFSNHLCKQDDTHRQRQLPTIDTHKQ
jgi:hypothetical protein